VICSSLSTEGSRIALDALSAGAVAIVAKPRLGLRQFLEDSRRELISTLKAAALSRPRLIKAPVAAAVARASGVAGLHALSVNKPIVIGSSTGGTQAIEQILRSLPAEYVNIVVCVPRLGPGRGF